MHMVLIGVCVKGGGYTDYRVHTLCSVCFGREPSLGSLAAARRGSARRRRSLPAVGNQRLRL